MTKTINLEQLGRGKISRLLWSYALPAIIGSSVNALYNIIDGIFVGRWIGDVALSGLGVVMPIMNLTAAVGVLVGVGSSSRISIALGENDRDKAERIAGTSFVMSLVLSGTLIALLYIFLKPVLIFAGANEETLPYAYDFLLVFLPGNLFLSLCYNFNNVIRASGYPVKAMLTMFLTVVVNIVLAPIFIKVLGWGMKGAAAATVVAMVSGFVFVMQHFISKNSYIRLRRKHVLGKIDWANVRAVASIGIAPFFIQVANSLAAYLVIRQLRIYDVENSTTTIGAYTIAYRLIVLMVMIIIGLTQGMQPIVGYNYGAKNYRRVKETLNYTIKVAVGITTIGFALCHLIPHALVGMFSPGELLEKETVQALQYITAMFPLLGFYYVVTTFFQSIGTANKSIMLSFARQILLLLPFLLLFPMQWGLVGVWMAIPASDALATLLAFMLYIIQIRKLNAEERSLSATQS